jgi:alkylation response protein AidB-like acyl-CoA dehydrogenase
MVLDCGCSYAAGRVLIAQGGVDGAKLGLTIALRYAANRPQFGGTLILDYVTHQRRLLPALANTYALQLAQKHLKVGGALWGGREGYRSAVRLRFRPF